MYYVRLLHLGRVKLLIPAVHQCSNLHFTLCCTHHFMQRSRCKCQVGVVQFQDDVREMFLVVLHLLSTYWRTTTFTKRMWIEICAQCNWTEKLIITGSKLHFCKAHAKINRKMGNSTSCKIVTSENFILILCTRDNVNFGFNRCS